MDTDVLALLKNPLAQEGTSRHYLRLVFSEAAKFGMDGRTIALLDDIAAMLGFLDAIPQGQVGHLAGPLVAWRSSPNQPAFDRIHEVEKLAYSQRALIAFGGAPPGHMVGVAEIVIACGNLHPGIPSDKGGPPKEYFEVFNWAGLDVLSTITGLSVEEILADEGKKDWKLITDDEVLKPTGRLHATYQEMATSIRREAIAGIKNHPRQYLRPVAAHFLESHEKNRRLAEAAGEFEVVDRLDEMMATIRKMFPNLGSLLEEADKSDEWDANR